MSGYTGRKGNAKKIYRSKLDLAKSRLKNLPYRSKEIIAAVFADGKSYKVNGCNGMEKAIPESVRIMGKNIDMYEVVWGKSGECSLVSKEELSTKLDNYFGVRDEEQQSKEVNHEEDR